MCFFSWSSLALMDRRSRSSSLLWSSRLPHAECKTYLCDLMTFSMSFSLALSFLIMVDCCRCCFDSFSPAMHGKKASDPKTPLALPSTGHNTAYLVTDSCCTASNLDFSVTLLTLEVSSSLVSSLASRWVNSWVSRETSWLSLERSSSAWRRELRGGRQRGAALLSLISAISLLSRKTFLSRASRTPCSSFT
ncbi:unnamed protein product, partial [Ixodes pacificus]